MDAEDAKYASAFAYWLACEAQIQPRETLTLTLEGLQVTAGESYAKTLTANYPDGVCNSNGGFAHETEPLYTVPSFP